MSYSTNDAVIIVKFQFMNSSITFETMIKTNVCSIQCIYSVWTAKLITIINNLQCFQMSILPDAAPSLEKSSPDVELNTPSYLVFPPILKRVSVTSFSTTLHNVSWLPLFIIISDYLFFLSVPHYHISYHQEIIPSSGVYLKNTCRLFSR